MHVNLESSLRNPWLQLGVNGVEYLSFIVTADAMASSGINCCSNVCQHKCM